MARRLFTVEDTFLITGRGLILLPGISEYGDVVRVGDSLLLVRPDGFTVASWISGLELGGGPKRREGIPILLADLNKDDVPIGTEVWSVDL